MKAYETLVKATKKFYASYIASASSFSPIFRTIGSLAALPQMIENCKLNDREF